MNASGKPMYTIHASAVLVRTDTGTTEVREATITVNMREIEPHTSIDVLEEIRSLTKMRYTVVVVAQH